MRKLAVVSLGCAKNLVDTEIILGQLLGAACELTHDFSAAEIILVNTCGFIEDAKKESIQQILEMARFKNPAVGSCQRLIVAGCLVHRYARELESQMPEVDVWLGLADLGNASRVLEGTEKGIGLAGEPFLNNENLPRFQVTLKHTAYVKIAEGCSHRCAYCAIPLIKGKFRSRHPDAVIQEIATLVANGTREINLIAQDITMYGYDLAPRLTLPQLITEILRQAKPQWLRLLYAYPSGITQPLLELMAQEESICKYLDLPIQHIHPRILKRMNRPDSPALIKQRLDLIRTVIPEAALRTTLLVGFPGETVAEFEELCRFVTAERFRHLGVFSYSKEEGTAAFQMKPQIAKAVREQRRSKLMRIQQKISRELQAAQIGKDMPVLVDRNLEAAKAIGRSQFQAPDVDGVIYLAGAQEPGSFVRAKITGSDDYNLSAEISG